MNLAFPNVFCRVFFLDFFAKTSTRHTTVETKHSSTTSSVAVAIPAMAPPPRPADFEVDGAAVVMGGDCVGVDIGQEVGSR